MNENISGLIWIFFCLCFLLRDKFQWFLIDWYNMINIENVFFENTGKLDHYP